MNTVREAIAPSPTRSGKGQRGIICLLLATLSLSLPPTISGQSDLVTSDGITSELHRSYVGRITFMSVPMSASDYTEADMLSAFELKEACDLNIRVFMAGSLTNAMARLAPGLPADELARIGNYQFAFFVDDALVYRENLHPGAGSAESKNTRTVFRVPFISTTNEDSWGRFLWNRFMMSGGEDALSGGTHTLRIEIRPYVNQTELRVGDLIAQGQLGISVSRPAVEEQQLAIQPIKPGSGWRISSAKYDRERIRELNRRIADRTFKDITSIVVIRNGSLLLEEYFNGATRQTLHDTRSVGKSFASALAGIAIADGFIKDENQTIGKSYDLRRYANYSAAKEKITIRQLMTMSSAFDGSDLNDESPGNEEKMYPTSDWVRFALDLPVDTTRTASERWQYFTGGVVVLGDILNGAVPGGLEKYADRKLFRPLGIRSYQWQYTPQHVVNTAGGLRMRSLDSARFGQLYRNRGRWGQRQIVLQAWVSRSLSAQVRLPDSEIGSYGYLFWGTTFVANDTSYEVFYASGNGGSKIIIFRDEPLVIVITATAYNTPYQHVQAARIVEKYLLPAVCLERGATGLNRGIVRAGSS